jgi:GNAT superfamily N-acetyltransferase
MPSAPFVRLPIQSGAPAAVGGQSEALQVFLQPVGDPKIEQRLGREKAVGAVDHVSTKVGTLLVLRTEGQKFKGMSCTTQGGRILLADPDGSTGSQSGIMAALNWTKMGADVVVSNICVHPDSRRLGLGSLLIDLARIQFPKIKADSNMTIAGALFMGYADAAQAALARQAKDAARAVANTKNPSP